MTPEQLERKRARDRAYKAAMTPEQREHKRAVDRARRVAIKNGPGRAEWMAKQRETDRAYRERVRQRPDGAAVLARKRAVDRACKARARARLAEIRELAAMVPGLQRELAEVRECASLAHGLQKRLEDSKARNKSLEKALVGANKKIEELSSEVNARVERNADANIMAYYAKHPGELSGYLRALRKDVQR